jgi:hypothetical protein
VPAFGLHVGDTLRPNYEYLNTTSHHCDSLSPVKILHNFPLVFAREALKYKDLFTYFSGYYALGRVGG